MDPTNSIDSKIRRFAEQAATARGLEFVHLELAGTKRNQVVRIYIDKPGGVTVEDCSDVSRSVEEAMDGDDFMPGPYVLEVSSPGLDRELYSLADFQKFVGSKAKAKVRAPEGGAKSYNGRIVAVDGEEITFEDRSEGEVKFPYSAVMKANLKFDIQDDLKRG
jgi:ribosome maturation factor RimP